MEKNDFLNNSLYMIKDKITLPATAAIADTGNLSQPVPTPPAPDKITKFCMGSTVDSIPAQPRNENSSYSKALAQRYEDYIKFRRDVMSRYSADLAILNERRQAYARLTDETAKSIELLQRLHDSAEKLPDSFEGGDAPASLAVSMKQLENMRLELFRQNAKLAEIAGQNNAANKGQQTSFLPELKSLPASLLLRIGLLVSAPLLLTALAAAATIAAAVYISMRI